MSFPRLKRFTLIAFALQCTAWLIRQWPWIALIVFIVVPPEGPHLRWEYSYTRYGNYKVYSDCHYLGVRGFVRYARTGDCPFIIWIDPDQF